MAKSSGTTRTSRPKKAVTDVLQQFTDDATRYAQRLMSHSVDYNDRSKTNYQKITAIDRTSLAKFARLYHST